MKEFKFKDWAGNDFIIKAKDRWEAAKKAKKEIVIQPCYLVDNIKIQRNGI